MSVMEKEPGFLASFIPRHASFCRDIRWSFGAAHPQAHTEPIFAFASTHKMDTDIPLSELVPILSTAGAEMYVEYP